jgi:hypothetical protein
VVVQTSCPAVPSAEFWKSRYFFIRVHLFRPVWALYLTTGVSEHVHFHNIKELQLDLGSADNFSAAHMHFCNVSS